MDLIYCAGSNRRLMAIAVEAGFRIGVRSDKQSYNYPVTFVDIEYRKPDWRRHVERVQAERPTYAVVPDLSDTQVSQADIARAVTQAQELAQWCATPLIVPKLPGQIALLPADLAIAYSIPTTYGGAHFGLQELASRRVHLLGGSPAQQQKIARWLRVNQIATVISADGNMAQKASQKASYWDGVWKWHERSGSHEPDLMYECWRLSCQHIHRRWQALEAA